MATGTDGDYWRARALPSAFKHKLLSYYIPQFGGMTGSRSGSVVYLDGYAGQGQYDSGESGSAEIALNVASHHQAKGLVAWTCFLAERKAESAAALERVAARYRARGVDVRVHPADVEKVLDEVLKAAAGLPLFLFLDPCGLALPFDRLAAVLASRPEQWPPTEFLLNFSMMALWRLGGNARSPKGLEASNVRMDQVCGGPWWRDHFTGSDYELGPQTVAAEYAAKLAQSSGMLVESIPVRKAPDHQPIYHLVFGTRRQHGLWVFGDAVARARDTWWEQVELHEIENDPGALFTRTSFVRPDPETVKQAAVPEIAGNIAELLLHHADFTLVEHTKAVFGDYYGQVTEPATRSAVKLLHEQGKTSSDGKGGKPRDLRVRR